jgi:1,4-dihydroxy-2-naphthoate octaprenyltransferase
MKVEARVFLLIAFFCWIVAIVYGFWSDKANGHVEVAGLAALILSGGLLFIAGSFFWFVSRRIDPRPEDRPDAEIAEGASDLGFFSPGSYWPFALALAATMAGTGLAFFQMWLVLVAVIGLLGAIGGLLFEYYAGGRKTL